jgi:drug/metabolite transporter (DMT)-like permease
MRDRSGVGTGILLITIGLLFMADRQGYMRFHNLWPVIIIVMGVVTVAFPRESPEIGVIAGRRGRRQYRGSRIGGGMWMILVGVLLLLNQNHWMAFRDSWPLFIVAGGLALIFGGMGRRRVDESFTDPNPSSGPVGPSGNSGDASGGGTWR